MPGAASHHGEQECLRAPVLIGCQSFDRPFLTIGCGEDEEERCQQVIRCVIRRILFPHGEDRQGSRPEVSQIGLVIHQPIIDQRYGNDRQQGDEGENAVLRLVPRQPPGEHAHQQDGCQRIDSHQRIACNGCQKHQKAPVEQLLRQTPERPQQPYNGRRTYRRHEEIASQLDGVQPVAQTHVRHEQDDYGDKGEDDPSVGDAEGAFRHPHQQRPPSAEQHDAQPGMVEMLCEEAACIREQAPRNEHLLQEEMLGIEKQIILLHLPEQVAFPDEQAQGDDEEHSRP